MSIIYRRTATPSQRIRICATGFSSASISTVLNRDVFIYDHSFTIKSWDESHRKCLSTKHPSSGHVIANYSSYIHNNSKYHFNSLGEFSLIFTSVIPLPSKLNVNENTDVIDIAALDKKHSILLHPDQLFISGLSINEVPTVVNLILQDNVIDAVNLKKKLPNNCVISKSPKLVIIASSNKTRSVESVTQVVNWFRSAIEDSDNEKKSNQVLNKDGGENSWPSPLLLLASELGGHRNSSSVLILPNEDSFEFVPNEETARTIIKSCYNVQP